MSVDPTHDQTFALGLIRIRPCSPFIQTFWPIPINSFTISQHGIEVKGSERKNRYRSLMTHLPALYQNDSGPALPVPTGR